MLSSIDSYIRCALLLLLVQWLCACTMLSGAKPVIPLEQSLSTYILDKPSAPTVLMFPGCGGGQSAESEYIFQRKAHWLNEHGFNAVVFDFTKMMGVENACMGQIKVATLKESSLAAFQYVAAQPYTENHRVLLLGWSMGASIALTVAQVAESEHQASVVAVAAYYPGCYEGLELTAYPTLLLMGMADNVVNPYDCLSLINRSPQKNVTYKTYAGAHHGFDVEENNPPRTAHFFWKKFTAAYDAVAADDAEKQLLAFLQAN